MSSLKGGQPCLTWWKVTGKWGPYKTLKDREIQTLNDRSENRLWEFFSEEEILGGPGNCASHRKDDAS